MEKTDTRPPFAASGGVIPPEFRKIKTPCYVLDETALIKNAELMGKIAEKTGCKMLLAQKAFSNYDCYHLLEPYLAGTEASGPVSYTHLDVYKRQGTDSEKTDPGSEECKNLCKPSPLFSHTILNIIKWSAKNVSVLVDGTVFDG